MRKKKKKSAEPEMGYCPFEHWLGRTRRLSAHGARARGWAVGAVGRWGTGARTHGARGRAGRAGMQGVGARRHAGGAHERGEGAGARKRGSRRGARATRRPGRAAGPAGFALGALSLF